MAEFEAFHSAVNRVPVLRPKTQKYAEKGLLSRDLFADGPATGHDRLAADRWSGSIDLEMTVRTPLVFGEQKNGVIDLPMRDDRPVIPPTMVKGMISRAYETLTCSRFRVFGAVKDPSGHRKSTNDHSKNLTYRADPADANSLLPGRICTDSSGDRAVEILDGFGRNSRVALIRDNPNEGHGTIVCKNHPKIRTIPGGVINAKQVFNRFRSRTPHGEEIEVQLTEWKDQKNASHLMVTGVWNGDDLEVFFEIPGSRSSCHFKVWGYPCRTSPDGKTSHDLYEGKTYERFFFKSDRQGRSLDGTVLPLDHGHLRRYAEVLRSYREHRDDPGDRNLLNRAASAYHGTADDALTDGDLVFVQLEGNRASSESIPGNSRVVDVFPTMVGRRSYNKPPRELAEDQGVVPLAEKTEASAADRLFGYVVSEAGEKAKGGDVASRGHLSFSMVDASEAHISREEKQLSPLLSPKPTSARRFLTKGSGETVKREDGSPLARRELFSTGQLLGSAAYPVHRELLNKQGFPEPATRLPKASDVDQGNASVRTTVRSWVKTGSVLRCTVDFTNLSRDELGALLWVLTPENLTPTMEKKKHPDAVGFLRMGLGKPLGLGVLEVRVADGGLRAVQGKCMANQYETLSGCLDSGAPVVNPTNFSLPDEEKYMGLPWVRAMQRAAFGYSDGAEVRYMTLSENKSNNQTDSKTGQPKKDRGLSPEDLFEDPVPIKVPHED